MLQKAKPQNVRVWGKERLIEKLSTKKIRDLLMLQIHLTVWTSEEF